MRPLGTRRVEVASVSRLDLTKDFRVRVSNFFHLPEIIMLRVCFLTTLAGVLMLLSVLLASYRRRSKSRVLKATLWASYTLTSYLIAFTMGQMLHSTSSSSKVENSDDILWAFYLLIVFGSADSFSSYSLVDSDQWRRYNCQFILKIGGLVILLVSYYQLFMSFITAAIILLMVLTIVSKVLTKNLSIEASGTAALHRSCKRIVDYMITEHEVVGDVAQADPSCMRGYRYLVQGEASKAQGSDEMDHVTLENVWNCRWELLSSRHTGDALKDTCLSFSLYRLLRLKYAGYKLPQDVNRKVFRLVRHGLMVSEENGYERAFRVVEDELALLFDSFYTKRPIIFEPRGHRLWLRFAESLLLGLVSSVFIFGLFRYLIISGEQNWVDGLYAITSLIALVIYLLSEILQSFILLFTTWMKVKYICKYVKGDLWLKRPFRRKCIERICKLPSFKPWERKLHQYSLFESYSYSPLQLFPKRFMYMFVDSPRDGQMDRLPPTELSVEVRKAVFDCLKNVTESPSNDGIAYMMKPHVSWECDVDFKLKTQAEVIMVWHIATTMSSGQPSSPEGQKNVRVATTLSKYLAYLVAFAPRLLPDHSYLTESLFDQTIAEARLLFKGCKMVTERIDKLRESERESGKNNTTLFRGARLAKQLLEVKVEADAIWETLAKFWTEMLLYIAPSKDNRAHAETLAFGGEFVTHLWALLYHAGIERSKGSMPSNQLGNNTSDAADPSTMPMTSEPVVPPVSMEIDPSTMLKASEPVVPPVSTEIEDAVVPPMIMDKKPDLG